ncbi:unnamed protein product, partial [marine sediment metagenome]
QTIALYGELGAGKTTFIQGLALGLGIKQPITSPSFVIMNQYDIPKEKFKLCHFDFYRYKENSEQSPADILDYLNNQGYLCLIEWADRVQKLVPKNAIKIHIKYLDENKRSTFYPGN